MSAALPSFDYGDSGVAVREDLVATHRGLLEHLRRPGNWFDGRERLAIAAASRDAAHCGLCRERKAALSPQQVSGVHEHRAKDLPEGVIEVAHRVRGDSGRLSRAWYEGLLDGGLGVGAYVEAVGITALLAGLDFFCRALGVPPPALPEALPGEPTGHVPAKLRSDIAWVPILTPENASGPEADLYDEAPVIPNIARALSMVPDHVRQLQRNARTHYLALADMQDPTAGRAIDRLQIELIAARVSALNECFY